MVDEETSGQEEPTLCAFCGLPVSPEHDLIELSESRLAHVACVTREHPEDHRKFIAFENAYGPPF